MVFPHGICECDFWKLVYVETSLLALWPLVPTGLGGFREGSAGMGPALFSQGLYCWKVHRGAEGGG